jgi:hypothetical protein
MPTCPYCQATHNEGQRYCNVCESYLLNPEAGEVKCPQCGIRVAPGQEICHKCNSPLTTARPAAPTAQSAPGPQPQPTYPTPPPPSGSLPPWVYAVLGAMGTLIVVLAALLLLRAPAPTPSPAPAPAPQAALPAAPVKPPVAEEPKPAQPETPPAKPETPEPQPLKPEPAKPEASEVRPAVPEAQPPQPETPQPPQEASLASQLEETLNTLREAQMKKDIVLYLSCYSYLFPSLDQKRKDALRYWEKFTFSQLMYSLEDVKDMGEDRAYGKVTWEIQVQGKGAEEMEEFTQTFKVGFARELGKWRIRSLKEED